MKILDIDDILAAAEDSDMPELEKAIAEIEAAAAALAVRLAAHLGIESSQSAYERDAGGLCVCFSPKTPDQPCPQVIDEGDPGGDWHEDEEEGSKS